MNAYSKPAHGRKRFFASISVHMLVIIGFVTLPVYSQDVTHRGVMPNLSGLAWVEEDLFIGVHDTKGNSRQNSAPRVSLIRLPKSEKDGVTWQPMDLAFPGDGGPSKDLESASRIPGNKGFLFAESGQEGEGYRRIFHAVYDNGKLSIGSYVTWPVPVENVEAIEVCEVGQQLVFLYAERADSLPSTKLRWSTFTLNPMSFGAFEEVTYAGVDPVGQGARPIVALTVDSDGMIYSVSAHDSGNDDGPFRSVVWKIGKITADENGHPKVVLGAGERLATLDGLKVESIVVRENDEGEKQLFVGTDDEHYGGILRPLPYVP